jgi:hypothetical protein
MKTRLTICNRKARYGTANEAHLTAARATITLRPYRCDRCGAFHLTSRTKGKRVPRPDFAPSAHFANTPNDDKASP